MRFHKYLQEAVIHADLKWLDDLVPKMRMLVDKSDSVILDELNKLFADWFIKFGMVQHKSTNTTLVKAGLASGRCRTIAPYAIRIDVSDLLCFKHEALFKDWIVGLKELLKHELTHREQLLRSKGYQGKSYMKGKEVDWQKYYSDKREIMVLAANTYAHMRIKNMSQPDMIKTAKDVKSLITQIGVEFTNLMDFIEEFMPGTWQYKLFSKYLYEYITTYKKQLSEQIKKAWEEGCIP